MTSPFGATPEDVGVFGLLTQLCTKTASKYCSHSGVSQSRLASKMKCHAYEILLKKTSLEIPTTNKDPISDLLSLYFVNQQSCKTVSEYKRCEEFKNIIGCIRQSDYGEYNDHLQNVLKFLIGISNTVKEDLSLEMYQNPFSFGLLDQMLPKPKRDPFGSPQPYSYFPSYVFELPYSIKRQCSNIDSQTASQTYTSYTAESFNSRNFDPEIVHSTVKSKDDQSVKCRMSLASLTSSNLSPYSTNCFNFPRLTAPRDLEIPVKEETDKEICDINEELKEVYKAEEDSVSFDIWELAKQVDKDIPEDIWEVVSKLPALQERRLIATCSREVGLWRRFYTDQMAELHVVTETLFIRHIMYLIIGVETKSFPYSQSSKCFYMKENLVLEGISKETINRYVITLLHIGTYYRRLYQFCFCQTPSEHFQTNGLIYEASREVARRYLLEFRLVATEIYEKCCNKTENVSCLPTLLQILYHMEPLNYEIEIVASIYKMVGPESNSSLQHGADLMSYLFNEITLVTHKKTASILFNSLHTVCTVYFKFIEKFIFEGELFDRYNEFFIRKDSQYVNSRSKRYWDKGFHITQTLSIPEFLRPVAKFILLCGKSLRLLKLCNPTDPLILLISSDHPSIKCCASFDELERQQQVLDVYRTRCLFVSGEPVTFDQILLKREAEKKAFTEMASLKQAETMEKIVAERKRLAQLIIAEKQHSLRVLEAAMAETKAAKNKTTKRQKLRTQLEEEKEKATEEVDSKLKEDERTKIMEYYSKLNMEVEKSKIHTEWKIKRLQLDQSRIQLLSTEERNLKREKLELQHQRNEEVMAMSIQSDIKSDNELFNRDDSHESPINDNDQEGEIKWSTASADTVIEVNKSTTQSSSDVLSAICNAAISIFGVKTTEPCDNNKELDAQGNVIAVKTKDVRRDHSKTSSDVIGGQLDNAFDNIQYLKMRDEASVNKRKAMEHVTNQTDQENNQLQKSIMSKIDEENNFPEWSPFEEAKRNKLKVLGAEMDNKKPDLKVIKTEPRTEAQKEALINRQKVLGVEYNLPLDIKVEREPANVAQEEALLNRKKAFDSSGSRPGTADQSKRSGLTLNLKPYSDTADSFKVSPNSGAITPGDMFQRLDLETPTTAEIPLEGALTSEIFTPRSESGKDIETADVKPNKDYLNSDGFNFSVIVDDEAISTDIIEDAPDDSPIKNTDACDVGTVTSKYSVFDIIDGSYNLDNFDPFGVHKLENYSKEFFSNQMDVEMENSCYTHPALIMEEVKKKPYNNIFASHLDPDNDVLGKVNCDNIATLTVCLQRSVMLPLTYQLEVVNNAILTYYLVNLDMYEHLRSLKDYFFLMDGEFSRSICRNLFSKLTKTLNPQELLNFATLHNILDKALGSSISHVHKFSENLSFTITECPLSFQHSSPDVLQCLSLTYSVSWPLNIILSQEALLRYAKVFQFLIKMRRIFWVLGEDFETLKLSAKLFKGESRKLLRSPQYISIQLYRHIMASFIRALDNYIVTTCILTSWTEFENDLKKARTLDDLYECHVVYIKKVLFRCLLNNRSTPVMKLLNDIFTVILKFSRVLKAGEWRQKDPDGFYTHTSFVQLEELFHLFEKVAKYLHRVVTKLMECGYQRHLVELLTMVNLNGYYDFDMSKSDHNASIQSQ